MRGGRLETLRGESNVRRLRRCRACLIATDTHWSVAVACVYVDSEAMRSQAARRDGRRRIDAAIRRNKRDCKG